MTMSRATASESSLTERAGCGPGLRMALTEAQTVAPRIGSNASRFEADVGRLHGPR
jgi:hypothetical protein